MPWKERKLLVRKRRSLPARLLRRAHAQLAALTPAWQSAVALFVTAIPAFSAYTWGDWPLYRLLASAACVLALLLFWRGRIQAVNATGALAGRILAGEARNSR